MKTENLLKLQAYLDDELTAQESRQVSKWLASDPDAQAVCRQLREAKTLLAGNEWPVRVPETREFYWSKIERRIVRLEAAADSESAPAAAPWWVRLAAPLAGVAVLIILVLALVKPFSGAGALAGYFHEIETPLEESNAISFHSQAAGMTVVWIDRSN